MKGKEVLRKLYTHETDLLKLFQKKKRGTDGSIDRMKQLSYSQDEINEHGNKFYNQICVQSFLEHRLKIPKTEKEYNLLLKEDKYKIFWMELKKLDQKLYQRAAILIK